MQTIKLEVENSKVDIVLNIIRNLKEDVVKRCEVITEDKSVKDSAKLSYTSFNKVWDNEEDAQYDKYLKI